MRVTIRDVRMLYCVRGAKQWAESNGIDFRKFLEEGIELEEIEKVGDPFSRRFVKLVQERENHGRR